MSVEMTCLGPKLPAPSVFSNHVISLAANCAVEMTSMSPSPSMTIKVALVQVRVGAPSAVVAAPGTSYGRAPCGVSGLGCRADTFSHAMRSTYAATFAIQSGETVGGEALSSSQTCSFVRFAPGVCAPE